MTPHDPQFAADLAELESRDPSAGRLIRALAGMAPAETSSERGARMADEAISEAARALSPEAFDQAQAPTVLPHTDEPLTPEERMAQFEAEVLIQQPAMVEGVALVLACAIADRTTVERLREDAVMMLTMPYHMGGEPVQQHIHAGRVAAAEAVARIADILESGFRLKDSMAPSTETAQ